MYHSSNYKSKIVMTAFNKQMETLLVTSEFQDMVLATPSNHQCGSLAAALFCIMYMYLIISYCVALAYSSDEKRAE